MAGKLIRFDELKGYGFITPDRGTEDVFVHVNDIDMDRSQFVPGARVEFVVEDGDRGLKASNVRLLEAATPGFETAPGAGPGVAAAPAVHGDGSADVLTRDELEREATELLLSGVPDLSGGEVVAVRRLIMKLAERHNWVDSAN
ncbi:hypothetical protein BJF85_00660 [Saccharomonospora sp. CUA-673]|nr:hypothetical protein BJF85_00660 [Saccharomonospora sp. CUA-673]